MLALLTVSPTSIAGDAAVDSDATITLKIPDDIAAMVLMGMHQQWNYPRYILSSSVLEELVLTGMKAVQIEEEIKDRGQVSLAEADLRVETAKEAAGDVLVGLVRSYQEQIDGKFSWLQVILVSVGALVLGAAAGVGIALSP